MLLDDDSLNTERQLRQFGCYTVGGRVTILGAFPSEYEWSPADIHRVIGSGSVVEEVSWRVTATAMLLV